MRKFLVALLEVAEVAAIAVVSVIAVRHFVVQPFLVSGESMVPNFHNGDYLLIDEFTYRLRDPKRGEVIVFRREDSTSFIKRVLGLPGERVHIEGGKVTIFNSEHPDGFLLEEGYLPATTTTDGVRDVALGQQEYYMLGDNREFSFDSRRWGPMEEDAIVGRVAARLWPVVNASGFQSQ